MVGGASRKSLRGNNLWHPAPEIVCVYFVGRQYFVCLPCPKTLANRWEPYLLSVLLSDTKNIPGGCRLSRRGGGAGGSPGSPSRTPATGPFRIGTDPEATDKEKLKTGRIEYKRTGQSQ